MGEKKPTLTSRMIEIDEMLRSTILQQENVNDVARSQRLSISQEIRSGKQRISDLEYLLFTLTHKLNQVLFMWLVIAILVIITA